MSSEIVKSDQQGALEVRQQVNQIQYLMKEVLQEGEHYGTVPGCGKKPTLLQPGAEKIAYMFHFVPSYNVTRTDLGAGHREYDVECALTHRETGEVVGGGLGLCSSMESKYRYRNKWVNGKKVREENPDIADVMNTVLKIAKKRAFVDAVKSTTAASDIFTQDIEDLPIAPKEDPRKGLWKEIGTLKEQALKLGVHEDAITMWMDAHITNDDGSPKDKKAYTAEDIGLLKNQINTLIDDRLKMIANSEPDPLEVEAEIIEDGLYDEDVTF